MYKDCHLLSKVPSSKPSPPRSCSGRQNWTEGLAAVSRLLGLQVLAQARYGWSARALLRSAHERRRWTPRARRVGAGRASARPPRDPLLRRLAAGGGFASMLAGLTLERWPRGPRTPSRAAGGRGQARAKELERHHPHERRVQWGGANIRSGAAVYGSFLVASVVGVASRPDGNHGRLRQVLAVSRRHPGIGLGDRSGGSRGPSGLIEGGVRLTTKVRQ